MRKIFLYSLLVCVLPGISGCTLVQELPVSETEELHITEEPVEQIEPKLIKIGTVTPLSEESNKLGENIVASIEMVIQEENSKNVNQIIMVHEDGSCDFETSKQATKTLIEEHNVSAIIGGICSQETLAIAEASNERKTPIVALYSTSPKIRDKDNDVFRINGDDKSQGVYASSFTFNSLNHKDIFVAYENSDYGNSLQKSFSDNFSKLGGTISLSATFQRDNENFEELLNQYNTSPSKVMYLVAMPQDAINLIDKAKEMNLNLEIIGSDTLNDDALNKVDLGENIKLKYITSYQNNDVAWKEFTREFQLKYGKQPEIGAAEGYDAINLILNAIDAKDATPENIIERLKQTKNYHGASGLISFDERGDNDSYKWSVVSDQN